MAIGQNKYADYLRQRLRETEASGADPETVFENARLYIRFHPRLDEKRRYIELGKLNQAIEFVKNQPEISDFAADKENAMTDQADKQFETDADQKSAGVAAPGGGRWTNRIIIALALLTLVGTAAFWQMRRMVPVDDLIAELRQAPKSDAAQFALKLPGLVDQRSTEDVTAIAKALADQWNPIDLAKISESLIADQKDEFSLKAAALIAEAGALKHNNAALLNRAGLEYQLGRWVKKDYAKAEKYLSNPQLAQVPNSQFYLGQVMVAADNPKRNVDEGMKHIRFAADNGLEAAKKLLAELGGKTP